MVQSLPFFFSFGKGFQASPEVACFLVPTLCPWSASLYLPISPPFESSVQGWSSLSRVYLGPLVINSSTVCACFVSSPDYLQMSLLMSSRWFLSDFTEPASDKPPGTLTETVW